MPPGSRASSRNGSTSPIGPGCGAWQKLRTRVTAEAIVGGVIGPVEAPRELILGRYDDSGRLRIAGRTTRLSPTATPSSARCSARPPRTRGPSCCPRTRLGRAAHRLHPRPPEVVVELSADLAIDGLRWRHPVRFVRVRAELTAADLAGEMRAV